MDVARAGWQVDDHEVERAPLGVGEQLIERTARHRATPNNGLVWVGEKADGQHLDAVLLDGLDFGLAVDFHGLGLFAGHVKHGRHARTVNVGVDEPHLVAKLGEGDGEVGRHRAFADAALAGSHCDDVLNAGEDLSGLEGSLFFFQGRDVNGARHGLAKRAFERKFNGLLHALSGVHRRVAGLDSDGQPLSMISRLAGKVDQFEGDNVLAQFRLHHASQGVQYRVVCPVAHRGQSSRMGSQNTRSKSTTVSFSILTPSASS